MWTDLVLTLILIGGLLTLLVKGAVDSGGMSTVIEKGGLISESFFTFVPSSKNEPNHSPKIFTLG